MTCDEARTWRELDPGEEPPADAREHLASCATCRAQATALGDLRAGLDPGPLAPLSSALRERTLAAIQAPPAPPARRGPRPLALLIIAACVGLVATVRPFRSAPPAKEAAPIEWRTTESLTPAAPVFTGGGPAIFYPDSPADPIQRSPSDLDAPCTVPQGVLPVGK